MKERHGLLYRTLAVACIEANMSLAQLAEAFGTSTQNFYRRLDKEKFSSQELEKLADCLGCDFRYEFVPRKKKEE